MKKRMLAGLFIILIAWVLVACSVEPEPGDFKSRSRCDLFAGEELSVVLYGIYPGDTTVKMYVKFESGKVIGKQDGRVDGLPWDYSVKIGEVESFGCDVFEGEVYAGRLYCILELRPEDRNAARPFAFRVNECDQDTSVLHQGDMIEIIVKIPDNNVIDVRLGRQSACGAVRASSLLLRAP